MNGYVLRFTVFPEDGDKTLSEFLQWAFPRHEPDELNRWIATERIRDGDGNVLVNALPVSGEISVDLPDHPEDPVDNRWQIIWETGDLMAVYKPGLLPVSRTTRNLYGTLISEVRRHTPWRDARLLHRLDTETSGLILLAKFEAADKRWKKRFDRLLQKKIYRAWIWGNPADDFYEITLPLSECADSAIRSRMYAVDSDDSQFLNPKACHTRVRVIDRRGTCTLVECELLTGRKHQIRAHLAAINHPIVGDKTYSHDGAYYLRRLAGPLTDDDLSQLGAPRQLLQAQTLVLDLRGEDITITLPQTLALPEPLVAQSGWE